jgi:hypothetical protein
MGRSFWNRPAPFGPLRALWDAVDKLNHRVDRLEAKLTVSGAEGEPDDEVRGNPEDKG